MISILNRFSFEQCIQHTCNAIDRQTAAISEEFYDNLVTCDIKSVDCLITALVVEPTAVQRLKGEFILCSILHRQRPTGSGQLMSLGRTKVLNSCNPTGDTDRLSDILRGLLGGGGGNSTTGK